MTRTDPERPHAPSVRPDQPDYRMLSDFRYVIQPLAIQHHSTVELVDRLVEAQLIFRSHDLEDRRRVLVGLTDAAEDHLARLSAIHLEELHRLRPTLQRIFDQVGEWSEDGDRA